MKKLFTMVLIIGVGIFLSMGCVTKSVLQSEHAYYPYKERIISFYINPKGNEVVFIGQKYHYIFNNDTPKFIDMLRNKEFLNLQQNNLEIRTRIHGENLERVYSDITVKISKIGLTPQQNSWLTSRRYTNIYFPEALYVNNYRIGGKRYLSNPQVNQSVKKLNQPIDLEIEESHIAKGDTLRKIAMTPLAVGADAVLVVGAVILSPVFLFMVLSK